VELGHRRRLGERAEVIADAALAASGDKKAITKELKRMVTESR
jgi:hypothetical protein